MRWPLQWKLALLISGLLALVLTAFGAAAYREMRDSGIERATGRLERVAEQLAVSSAANSAPRIEALKGVTADPVVIRALTDPSTSPSVALAVTERLERIRRSDDSTLLGWEVWSANGARRLLASPASVPADSAALADARALAVELRETQRSDLYGVGNRTHLWTVVPVVRDSQVIGVLAEHRRIANNPRTAQAIRELIGDDVAVHFASAGSRSWSTIGGAPVPAPFPLPPRAVDAARVVGAGGEAQYVAYAGVRGSPWLIVLSQPEAAVLQRSREFLQFMLLLGIGLLLAGAAGAWLLGRHVTQPLRGITRAAKALGDGEFSRRVDVTGSHELAQLSTTFNSMAAGLGSAHNELAERNMELQRANDAKSQFLAMMSHELRTPLNAIGGYTELLELGLRGPVTREQITDLARIRRNRDHLLSIIDDILNFTRAGSGHLRLALVDIPVGAALSDTMAVLGTGLDPAKVRVVIAPVPAGATVRADRDKLQQILLNLLTNAVRFTDFGGEIRILTTLDADHVRIQVRDTGIGIPTEKLDDIFEPFIQLDGGLTRQVGGTGLGLAISRELATAMDGALTAESEVGVGSTFTLTLPRASGTAAPVEQRVGAS